MVQSDDETGRRADADHLRLSRSVYVEPRLVDHLARPVDGRRADADHLRLSRSAYVEHLAPAVDGRASTDRLRPEGVPVGDHLARSGPGEARRVDEFWGLLARTVRGEPRHVDGRLLSPLSRFLPPFSRGVHELSGGVNLRQIVQSGRAELRRVDELRSLDGPRTAWSVPGERRIAHNLPVTTDEGHRVGSGRRGPRGLLDVLYDNFDRAHDGRMIAAALPVVAEADAAVLPGVVEAEDHAAAADDDDDDDAAGAVAAEDNLANPDPDAAAEDQVAGEDVNAVDLGDEAIADRRALLCAGFGLFFAVALVLASVAYEAGMVQARHEGFEFSVMHQMPRGGTSVAGGTNYQAWKDTKVAETADFTITTHEIGPRDAPQHGLSPRPGLASKIFSRRATIVHAIVLLHAVIYHHHVQLSDFIVLLQFAVLIVYVILMERPALRGLFL